MSLVTGLLTGIVGGLFRILLAVADQLRGTFVAWAHRRLYIGWVGPVTMGVACAALARLIVVRLSPELREAVYSEWKQFSPARFNQPVPSSCPPNSSAAFMQ